MKTTVITLAALILAGSAMAGAATAMVKVKADGPTDLYGGQAASVTGDIKRQNGDFFPWRGGGRLSWEVWVETPGDYEVNLCHAAEPNAVGQQLQITGGQDRLSYSLAVTKGVFGNKSYLLVPMPGSLHLPAGTNTIAIDIPDAPAGKPVLAFRSLELVPTAAKALLEADRRFNQPKRTPAQSHQCSRVNSSKSAT